MSALMTDVSEEVVLRPTPKRPWASPIVYLVALVLVSAMLAPVVYIIFGGFRTNSQITIEPGRAAEPLGPRELPRGAARRDLLA